MAHGILSNDVPIIVFQMENLQESLNIPHVETKNGKYTQKRFSVFHCYYSTTAAVTGDWTTSSLQLLVKSSDVPKKT